MLARQIGAELLWKSGHRDQGLLLLRDALIDSDGDDRKRLLRSLAAWADGPDSMIAALPDPAAVSEFLELVGTATPPRWLLLRELSERALRIEGIKGAGIWLGRAALGLRDADSALFSARTLLSQREALSAALLFADLVDLLDEKGRTAEAEALARQALQGGDRAELLLSLARLDEKQGVDAEARQLLDRALRLAVDLGLLARIHEVYGDLEARAGNPHQALAHRMEAADLRRR